MKTISTILVPYDYSPSAERALGYAVEFVASEEIKINLIYVSEKANKDKMRVTYDNLCEKYEGKLKVPMMWSLGWDGSVTDIIIEARQDKKADLIIMGTSGTAGGKEITQTSKLVKNANCPVLVIPEDSTTMKLKNISLVLGKNEIDRPNSLNTLLSISQRFDAKVHVLTVQNTPGTFGYSKSDQSNENMLMYHLENFYSEHTFIENPDIIEGIFSYANNHDIDMIVILRRNHAKNATPSEGLLTEELVLRTKIPVLTIE